MVQFGLVLFCSAFSSFASFAKAEPLEAILPLSSVLTPSGRHFHVQIQPSGIISHKKIAQHKTTSFRSFSRERKNGSPFAFDIRKLAKCLALDSLLTVEMCCFFPLDLSLVLSRVYFGAKSQVSRSEGENSQFTSKCKALRAMVFEKNCTEVGCKKVAYDHQSVFDFLLLFKDPCRGVFLSRI